MKLQDDVLKEQDLVETINLQEQFGDGLRDQSISAAQILAEQEEARRSDEQRAPLLVPERTSLGYIS